MKNKRPLLRSLGAATMIAVIGFAAASCENGDTTQGYRHLSCTPTWGPWVYDPAPTCTTPGTRTRTCEYCGAPGSQTMLALGHDLGDSLEVTIPATCTTPGEGKRDCLREGCDFRAMRIIPAGCIVGDWVGTATCTDSGNEKRTCRYCDFSQTRLQEPLGHDWNEWAETEHGLERTCRREECGLTVLRSYVGHCGCGQSCCIVIDDCDMHGCDDPDYCACPGFG